MQIREGSGILLLFLSLLSLLAMVYSGGPMLTNLRHLLFAGFGYGWLLPTAGVLALSVYLIWPHPPPLGPLPALAAVAAALACLGLLSLASASAGGAAGQLIEHPLSSLGGGPGAVLLLLLSLLLGLVLAFRLSPGGILLAAARGGRRAYAERRRLEELVGRSQAAAKRRPKKAAAPALLTAAEPNLDEILRPLPETAWRPAPTSGGATLPSGPSTQLAPAL
ncbi:MAG: hypothetical protein M3072_17200, partial [Candidatus Dormibacteraeota bacterium]|nr:hypothetical protein [Candidatus Dormibacteraeota bacterium]